MPGIYLHIPFCKQACSYCDFHFSVNRTKQTELVQAMLRELQMRSHFMNAAEVETIYFGGGTPSILSLHELNELLRTIKEHYRVSPVAEITLECNPDDLSEEKLQGYAVAGINRLSIGLQSFNDEELKWMNRAHTARESLNSVKLAQKAGFTNITVDLIYGSRFQSLTQWEETLKTVTGLSVQHVSAYNLTIEQKTALGNLYRKGQEPQVDEELSSMQFEMMQKALAASGYIHYEISNFGKEGYFSKHNTGYWNGSTYIGVGPSAHSFDGIKRWWNVPSNSAYIQAIQTGKTFYQEEQLSVQNRYNEYIMTRLRTMWGCNSEDILKQFGEFYANKFKSEIRQFSEYLNQTGNTYILNASGKLMADRIASELFAD